MAEDYVRPPILGAEPPSRGAATWRFRAVVALIFLCLAAGIIFLIQTITASNDNGGTIGAPATAAVTAPPGR
ncbi:MAG: hypothetical protein JO079_08215 [Frankiaceae bacterium]|nr:hypothetical protein [Frankiaceae bacterium]MBV9369587.1 hypothetical protein [Frankiales bacterium]